MQLAYDAYANNPLTKSILSSSPRAARRLLRAKMVLRLPRIQSSLQEQPVSMPPQKQSSRDPTIIFRAARRSPSGSKASHGYKGDKTLRILETQLTPLRTRSMPQRKKLFSVGSEVQQVSGRYPSSTRYCHSRLVHRSSTPRSGTLQATSPELGCLA